MFLSGVQKGAAMRILVPLLVAVSVFAGLVHAGDKPKSSDASQSDEELVNDFTTFAKSEWPRILDAIGTGYENAEELMGATKLPMSRKQMYVVVWIADKPSTYTIDVIRTDSLTHPVKGIMRFTVLVERGTLMVKGPKAHCNQKPLKECLAAGGKIVKRGIFNPMGGKVTVAQSTEVKLTYVRDGAGWVRETDETVIQIITTMPTISSMQ